MCGVFPVNAHHRSNLGLTLKATQFLNHLFISAKIRSNVAAKADQSLQLLQLSMPA